MTEPRRYAEGTNVPVEKTKAEIETLLRRHGASAFAQAWDEEHGMAIFQCRIKGRMIKFEVKDPDPANYKRKPRTYTNREPHIVARLVDQELRRRWRARLLITKAKLEMIEAGDTTFDAEFMADIMLPDGTTMGRAMGQQIKTMYETGHMPKLLAAMPGPKMRRRST